MLFASIPCCCAYKIGFDENAWAVTGCDAQVTVVEDIKDDISLLDECIAVFCGNNNDCGEAIRWEEEDWPTIKEWVEAGGRLWIGGEWAQTDPEQFSCIQDADTLNEFLDAMGSGIVYVKEDNTTQGACTAGTANIAQDFTPFNYNRCGTFTGGTTVWLGQSSKKVVVCEEIGDGFIFVTSDSNLYSNSCTWFKRIWQYDSEDII